MHPTHRAALLILLLGMSLPPTAQAQMTEADALKSMKWRAIGPANMGGRVTAITGVPGDASTYYVGGADGGVFKTTNGGVTFEALFTDQRAYSVGALALAPSDANVVWLGSGEGDPRNSVGYGNGVYRSLDGGATWTHLGLDDTERIKRIVVHPDDPDVALVCALGHEWGANEERGVFKTTDGGQSWSKVLYLDEDTGCSDLAMEEANPRILYAGMWTFRRRPWRFDDGGMETAPYRSMDGGETWEKITKGLPKGPMTRIGVAVARSSPNIVYLITEFKEGGTLFRSDDRGARWHMVNDNPNVNFRRRGCAGWPGPRVGGERRTRCLQNHRRRPILVESPLPRRRHRLLGPGDGRGQPAHPLRRHVDVPPPPLALRRRRHGNRALPVDGRRRDVGKDHEGPAERPDDAHRRGRGSEQS